MTQIQIDQAITDLENLVQIFKSFKAEEQSTSADNPATSTLYTIEEFVDVSPYKSPTSIYRILEKLDLGASFKKDIGTGKPRLYYSKETVEQVLQYIEDRDNNRGMLVAV